MFPSRKFNDYNSVHLVRVICGCHLWGHLWGICGAFVGRVVAAMFARVEESRFEAIEAPSYTPASGVFLVVLTVFTIGLGLIPEGLMRLIRTLEIVQF